MCVEKIHTENNNAKYPEYMLRSLRRRRGLSEFDSSEDDYINNMTTREIFKIDIKRTIESIESEYILNFE